MNAVQTPTLDASKWLLKQLDKTCTAQLVESLLFFNPTFKRLPDQTNRAAMAANFVSDQLSQACDYLDVEYGSVDIPKALACLELSLSIEVLEGEVIPPECALAEVLHRLLSHELALSKRNQTEGVAA